MAKVVIKTDGAPESLAGYSQAIKSNGFIFVSGQGPFDAKTGNVVGTTIQEHNGAMPTKHRCHSEGGWQLDRPGGERDIYPRRRKRLCRNERRVG